MTGGSEYEPKDSRNVTGTAKTEDGRWTGAAVRPDEGPRVPESDGARVDASEEGHGSELEPKDSRNVTGTAKTEDGRWTGAAVRPDEGPQIPETDRVRDDAKPG